MLGSGISMSRSCMALTISLRRMFDLCTFSSPYSLDERGFVGFNVDLILLGMLLFSTRILVFYAIVLVGFLSNFLCFVRENVLHLFFIVMCSWLYCRIAFIRWKHDVCVLIQVLEGQSLLFNNVDGRALKRIGYLDWSADIICLFW